MLESKRSKFPSFKSAIPLSRVKRPIATCVQLYLCLLTELIADSATRSESPDYIGSYNSQHQQSVLPTVITISTDVVRDSEVQAAKDAAAGYVKSTAW